MQFFCTMCRFLSLKDLTRLYFNKILAMLNSLNACEFSAFQTVASAIITTLELAEIIGVRPRVTSMTNMLDIIYKKYSESMAICDRPWNFPTNVEDNEDIFSLSNFLYCR